MILITIIIYFMNEWIDNVQRQNHKGVSTIIFLLYSISPHFYCVAFKFKHSFPHQGSNFRMPQLLTFLKSVFCLITYSSMCHASCMFPFSRSLAFTRHKHVSNGKGVCITKFNDLTSVSWVWVLKVELPLKDPVPKSSMSFSTKCKVEEPTSNKLFLNHGLRVVTLWSSSN